MRGDLIEVYKIMRGILEWVVRSFFPGWKSQLLGGIGLRCEGQDLKEMYEARGWWVPGTPLLGEGVEADTVMSFKERLDKYMNRMGIEG